MAIGFTLYFTLYTLWLSKKQYKAKEQRGGKPLIFLDSSVSCIKQNNCRGQFESSHPDVESLEITGFQGFFLFRHLMHKSLKN